MKEKEEGAVAPDVAEIRFIGQDCTILGNHLPFRTGKVCTGKFTDEHLFISIQRTARHGGEKIKFVHKVALWLLRRGGGLR